MLPARIATKHLLWKELQQLWPLAASSVLIAALIHVLGFLNQNFRVDEMQVLVVSLLVGLPSLFAVGVGALLVGQEKEQRTMQWLTSLPVGKRDIISSKLSVGLMGLIAMWLVSLLIAFVVARGDFGQILNEHFDTWSDLFDSIGYPLHSLFLLLAGFALAWRFSSSFLALALLVPVAFVPHALSWIAFHTASNFVTIAHDPSIWVPPAILLIPCQITCCIVAWTYLNRWAMVALGPASLQQGFRATSTSFKAVQSPFQPYSALLWQFVAQNKILLWTATAMLSHAMLLFLIAASFSRNYPTSEWLGLLAAIGCILIYLTISWLGVAVFQGDTLHGRVRFLSDRGISPKAVWLTRQAVPAIFLGLSILIGIVGIILLAGDKQQTYWQIIQMAIVPIIALSITVYCVSQWIGQLIPSPILSALAGPTFSVAAIGYLALSIESLGASLGLLVILVGLLPLCTYILTRRWMDQRYDLKYWLTHAIVVLLFLCLPLLSLAYVLITTPSMSADTRAALMAEYGKSMNRGNAVHELVIQTQPVPSPFDSSLIQDPDVPATPGEDSASDSRSGTGPADSPKVGATMTIKQKTEYAIQSLQDQLSASSGPVRPTLHVLSFLKAELSAARTLQSQQISLNKTENTDAVDTTAGPHSTLTQHYDPLVELTTTIIERTRLSTTLSDQEMADRLEIMLVYELQQFKGRDFVSSKTLDRALRILSDSTTRNAARRAAIAANWQAFQHQANQGAEFAGVPYLGSGADGRKLIVARRHVDQIVELLWKLANANSTDTTQLRAELATKWNLPAAYYGLGKYGANFRADNFDTYHAESNDTFRMAPGSQWHAEWERLAQSLTSVAP